MYLEHLFIYDLLRVLPFLSLGLFPVFPGAIILVWFLYLINKQDLVHDHFSFKSENRFKPLVCCIYVGVSVCGCEKVEAMLPICQKCRVPAVSMCEYTVLLFCSSKWVPFKAVKQKALLACPQLSHFTEILPVILLSMDPATFTSLYARWLCTLCALWNGTWCNTQTYGRKSECSLFGRSSKKDLRSIKADKDQSRVKQSP